MMKTYVLRICCIFVFSLLVYLCVANFVLAPMGYYGTREQPRFSDPWIARSQTILRGGLLYRDVFTTTPPLMNYVLIPPAVFAGWFEYHNPWTTLGFMVYFSLFNLFTALLVFYTAENSVNGYRWAACFLLNPLTFGNTVLRRQDESVLVFFFAAAFFFLMRKQHVRSSIAIGSSLLIKLTGGMAIPVAFSHTRNWRYLIVPFIVFGLVFVPFLLMAGEAAMFWDVSQQHTEHPFQFGGISLGNLWLRWQNSGETTLLRVYSVGFVLGVLSILAWLVLQPQGAFEDFAALVTAVLLLSAKLHCGYFSILVFAMTPLLACYRLHFGYFAFGTLALLADICKWPVRNYPLAFWLMVVVYMMLIGMFVYLRRSPHAPMVTKGANS